jgi:PhnB protein
MAKKIDPLNKKQYGAVSAMLTVSDITAAVAFYQKALGFSKRGIMNGPDGKPIHAELTLRGTTLMLGPENPALGKRSAKTVGASPAGLFLYVENVDKVVAKAVSLGATAQGQVMDMFWGDRCGAVVDPEIRVDGGHAHGSTYVAGNEKENEGANGAAADRCGNRGLSGHSLDDPLLARFGVKCLRSRSSGGLC